MACNRRYGLKGKWNGRKEHSRRFSSMNRLNVVIICKYTTHGSIVYTHYDPENKNAPSTPPHNPFQLHSNCLWLLHTRLQLLRQKQCPNDSDLCPTNNQTGSKLNSYIVQAKELFVCTFIRLKLRLAKGHFSNAAK